ncbi:PAS domain-containing protein [Paracoccus sp. TRP]|uniref:PAS domain-containing protein n=1 Tax=Paracoccus sp. TRP TaxID=412597 RepID=UPI000225F4DE|nr:PAS domain-containing protein [Paracoccus sp. TRP]
MSEIQRFHHNPGWAIQAIQTSRAVLILDRYGRIIAVNQGCLRLYGYQRDELIGRPASVLLEPSGPGPAWLWRMIEAPDEAEAWLNGLVQIARSGRRIRTDARLCPIRDEQGQVCLNVLFLREPAEEEGPLQPDPALGQGRGQVIRLSDWVQASGTETRAVGRA